MHNYMVSFSPISMNTSPFYCIKSRWEYSTPITCHCLLDVFRIYNLLKKDYYQIKGWGLNLVIYKLINTILVQINKKTEM